MYFEGLGFFVRCLSRGYEVGRTGLLDLPDVARPDVAHCFCLTLVSKGSFCLQ